MKFTKFISFAGIVLLLWQAFLVGGFKSSSLAITGFLTGIVLVYGKVGLAGGLRNFLIRKDGNAFFQQFLLIFFTFLLFVPIAHFTPSNLELAPISLSLVFGSILFGIGMQLSNACGSGCILALGTGSKVMLYAIPTFILGSLLGSFWVPSFLALGSLKPVLLHPLINLALLVAVLSCFLWSKKAQVPTKKIFILLFVASVSLGLIFLVALSPWQVTFGFTLWGAKLYSFLGGDLVSSEFWNLEMPKTALQNPLLRDTSTLVNLGVILGALAWVSFSKTSSKEKISCREIVAGILGGLMMGIGARFAFGCNIGAFIGGIASGSLHGWVWIVFALLGTYLGIQLRPLFGMSK